MSDRTTTQVTAGFAHAQISASQVSGVLQGKCASCGNHTIARRKCEECEKGSGLLQRKSNGHSEASKIPPIVHEVVNSPGQALDAGTRAFFEPRFGRDFSAVRVHTDAKAAESAREVNALAYTVGRDVVFGVEQYEPGTTPGQRLLAHELTHVVQQRDGFAQASEYMGQLDDIYEQEAREVADTVSQSGIVRAVTRTSGLKISRDGGPDPIWGGFRIRGDNNFINKVRKDLDRLNATQNGSALLQEIKENRTPWYRPLIPIESSGACGFLPQGISYNANRCNVLNRCEGSDGNWTSVPNYVYLHHEIVHAYLYHIKDKGYDDDRECMATGLGSYFTTIPYNENRLRCELNLPVRPCYDRRCRQFDKPDCNQTRPAQKLDQRR